MTLIPAAHAADDIAVADPALRAAINTELGQAADAAISTQQAESLTGLNASALGITNISGIGNLVNRTGLNLYENDISDISVVENMSQISFAGLRTTSSKVSAPPKPWTNSPQSQPPSRLQLRPNRSTRPSRPRPSGP